MFKSLNENNYKNLVIKVWLEHKNYNCYSTCKAYITDGLNQYDYIVFNKKALGYGYDKSSSCLSDCWNEFINYFEMKKTVRYNKKTYRYMLGNKSYYGLYDNRKFMFGVGCDTLINCLQLFKNVKLKQVYYGIKEDYIEIELKRGVKNEDR